MQTAATALPTTTTAIVEDTATLTLLANTTVHSLSSDAGTVIDITSGTTLTEAGAVTTAIAGTISGAGGLTKSGTGTLTISGANVDYTGAVAASAGTILLDNADSLSSSNAITLSGVSILDIDATLSVGTLTGAIGNTIDIANTLTFTAGSATSSIFAGVTTTTTGNFVKVGTGTLTLSGTNNFTGNTLINAGILKITHVNGLSDSTPIEIISGATLDVDANLTVASIEGAGGVDIGTSSTLTTGNSSSQSITGVITGGGTLQKQGSGTLTLGGTNDYSGGSIIAAGILEGTTSSIPGNTITNSGTTSV